MCKFVVLQAYAVRDKNLSCLFHLDFEVPRYTLAHLGLLIEMVRWGFADRHFHAAQLFSGVS